MKRRFFIIFGITGLALALVAMALALSACGVFPGGAGGDGSPGSGQAGGDGSPGAGQPGGDGTPGTGGSGGDGSPGTGGPGGDGTPGTGQPGGDWLPGPGAGAGTPRLDELYSIPTSVSYSWSGLGWVVDRDGATIPGDRQYTVLYDVLSGEPQCLTLTRAEKTGVGEYGEIIGIDTAALFDLDGNMIYDWGEYSYSDGFGDFVVRRESLPGFAFGDMQEEAECELLDFRAGRTFIPGVGQASRLTDDKVLLLDSGYRPLGVVDGDGSKLSGFPVDVQYANAWAWDGYIMAIDRLVYDYGDEPGRTFLLTPDFEQLFSYASLEGSPAGGVLRYDEETGTSYSAGGVVRADGTELYRTSPGEDISYFDRNFIVLRHGEYDSFDDPIKYKIIRTRDGEVLCDGIDIIAFPWDYQNEDPAEHYVVYKDGFLLLINMEKGEAERKEMPGVTYITSYKNGFFCVEAKMEGDESTNIIFDGGLNEVIPGGAYSYVSQAMRWVDGRYECYGVFSCYSYGGRNTPSFVDLVDSEGRVLVAGLNAIYDVGPDRVAVRKGFNIGLMDWQGNWIVKRSLFSELQDD